MELTGSILSQLYIQLGHTDFMDTWSVLFIQFAGGTKFEPLHQYSFNFHHWRIYFKSINILIYLQHTVIPLQQPSYGLEEREREETDASLLHLGILGFY